MTKERTPATIGRPTKYDANFHPIWAEKLAKLGATDEEMADAFDVVTSTLWQWSNLYPEFSNAKKKGKQFADAEVAHKLFNRATGYSHEETDVKVIEGQVVLTEITKNYAPDTTAAIFWLKNRQPAKWRDRPPEAVENESMQPVKIVVEVQDARKPDATT